MFGDKGKKISRLLNRETKTEQIQSQVSGALDEDHPSPKKAKEAIASYNRELKNLETEIKLLDSTDIVNNQEQIFKDGQRLLKRTVEIKKDISKIENLIDEWIEALSPKPNLQRSHEICVEIENILDDLPESESKSRTVQLVENIERVHDALQRVFGEAQEAKRELEKIEKLGNSNLEAEESELEKLFSELQNIEKIKKNAEKLRQEKKEAQEKYTDNLRSVNDLKSQLERLSSLLGRTPKIIFELDNVDIDLRMSQLGKAVKVNRRLKLLPDVLENTKQDQLTRREVLTGSAKLFVSLLALASGGFYEYLRYDNIKNVDEKVGGTEVFFTGGEDKPYQDDNAIKAAISGDSVAVNIIHIRLRTEQPSYNRSKFENSIRHPLKFG